VNVAAPGDVRQCKGKGMSELIPCGKEECHECERIVVRTYRELRAADYSDRDAFISAVRVLELRHPGHERSYYFRRVARALGTDGASGRSA
jgi:hypothetical protein